ncbi:MAG: hypothetical protein HY270_16135 [Deltaproteobacteria bacterium]|nr:hypothetical protein [Deltaproteobacteria bacterium]
MVKRGQSIKDVFYETRVLKGRDFTVRRFAKEVLGDAVDPVMLSYIEKGKRFPSEALVRRLAALRNQDPHELLALLWRDRMLYAFGKELRRVLHAPRAVEGVEDAELAVRLSQAIAALPDDASWITLRAWRSEFSAAPRRAARGGVAGDKMAAQVEKTLRHRGLVEIRGSKVRRKGRHFVAQDLEERRTLAMEFCALFVKGLLDKLALPDQDTGTYLRNHYLNIDVQRLPVFQKRLDSMLRALAEEFAADTSSDTKFLNILVNSTTL